MAGEILDRLIFVVILTLFATPVSYLVTKFLIYEDGPRDVLRRIRSMTGIIEYEEIGEDGNPRRKRQMGSRNFLSSILWCYNCLSFYVSLGVALAAAHLSNVAFSVGDVHIAEGAGLTLVGLLMWWPLCGATIILFDYLGTPHD